MKNIHKLYLIWMNSKFISFIKMKIQDVLKIWEETLKYPFHYISYSENESSLCHY